LSNIALTPPRSASASLSVQARPLVTAGAVALAPTGDWRGDEPMTPAGPARCLGVRYDVMDM